MFVEIQPVEDDVPRVSYYRDDRNGEIDAVAYVYPNPDRHEGCVTGCETVCVVSRPNRHEGRNRPCPVTTAGA